MTKIKLDNITLANSSVSNKHTSLIKENGVLEGNKPYWGKTEEYIYKLSVSNIEITKLEYFYDIAKQDYFVMGHCSLNKKTWSEKTSSYNFTNEEKLTVRSIWDTLDDYPVRLALYVNGKIAIDFGSITNNDGSEPFLIKIDKGADTFNLELKSTGKVLSKLPDQEDKRFDIDMTSSLCSVNEFLPELNLDPNYIEVPDKIFPPFKSTFEHQDSYILPNDYTKIAMQVEDRFFYTINMNKVDFTNMVIEYNTRTERYVLSGEYAIEYKRSTLLSKREKINENTIKVSDITWLDYTDDTCYLDIKINKDNLAREVFIINNEATINEAFSYDLGSKMDQVMEISVNLNGNVLFRGQLDNLIELKTSRTVSKFNITKAYINEEIDTEVIKPTSKEDIDDEVLSGQRYIKKTMESFDGQRYVIGIRDINIKKRSFESQSELVTKKFETEKAIESISLYSKEIIPKEFLDLGLEYRNEWIQYYISIDDLNWHRISPMDHRSINGLSIHPIIYEINSIAHNDGMAHKAYLKSKEDIYSIRLKIILARPSTAPHATPMLQEYALKCMLKEGQ